MTVCPTFSFGILACALSALAAAFSALRIGFSSAGSDRSSSVKRRRGSLFKPFSQHEGGHHVVQLCINGHSHGIVEHTAGQVGIKLCHHIGQDLRLCSFQNRAAHTFFSTNGAPDLCQTEKPHRPVSFSSAARSAAVRHSLTASAMTVSSWLRWAFTALSKTSAGFIQNVGGHNHSSSFFNS